jgi:hypothetical protein
MLRMVPDRLLLATNHDSMIDELAGAERINSSCVSWPLRLTGPDRGAVAREFEATGLSAAEHGELLPPRRDNKQLRR